MLFLRNRKVQKGLFCQSIIRKLYIAFNWPFQNQSGIILFILWRKPLIFKFSNLLEKGTFAKAAFA
jgi:hypothetical protein